MRPLAVGDKVRHKLSRHVGEVKTIDESGVTAVFNDGHCTIHDTEPGAFVPVDVAPKEFDPEKSHEFDAGNGRDYSHYCGLCGRHLHHPIHQAAEREIVELTLSPTYKVGDRVRLIREPFSGCDVPVGSVGVVTDAWNSGGYDVRFEDIKIMCIASHLEAA